MTRGEDALAALQRRRPEWAPWLTLVEEVVREGAGSAWDPVVRAIQPGRNGSPLLDRAAIPVPDALVRDLLARLVRIAVRGGAPKLSALDPAISMRVDATSMFSASLRQDHGYVANVAAELGSDAEALQAVAALLAVPFLQTCQRKWGASVPEGWVEGYCPVCASWPAFAEVRGIERTRCLRCGRCGAAWHAHTLRCPFCSTDDHDELVTLVPQKPGTNAVIEACKRCRGYLKTFTKLQGCPPSEVMLEDLASVELDVAALEQGYSRPMGTNLQWQGT
jgi:FdhE protein